MSFLFPYQDFLTFSRVAVTPWFITAIMLYFLLSSLYLYRRLRRLNRTLDEHTKRFSVERVRSDLLLRTFWWEYQQSFLGDEGSDRHKTDLDARAVFDEHAVIAKHVNLRYWAAVPGILLGLGIFGSFMGLTLGIKGVDTSTSAALQSGIQTLLAGMQTSFLTSLWGMFSSIAFTIMEKTLFNGLSRKLTAFCWTLDSRYKASKADRLRFERQDREQFLMRLFSIDLHGEEITPGRLLRGLLENSYEQTMVIEELSRWIGSSMRVCTETTELRGRIKATIEETQRAGVSQDDLDGFLEQIAAMAQQSKTPRVPVTRRASGTNPPLGTPWQMCGNAEAVER